MFYRVRTRLTDTPGALAMLAQHCGNAGVNILALQIYPELGAVTDDLVVETPDSWTAAAVVELVSGAGGDEVSVVPCATHDLVDQPTAWLKAAQAVLEDPDSLPAELTGLLGARVSWSATEQVRAAALAEFADRARSAAGSPPASAAGSAVVEYELTEESVLAKIGPHVVGAARLHAFVDDGVEASLEVAPAWRRLGIGRQLLRQVSGLAAARGASELTMLAPPTEEGVVPVLAAAGMRGRIRLTEMGLTVHVSLAGVRPIGHLAAR
ncbi:GNAT family N-acetyltransferase [Nocardioides marmoriginsengisoli]|uniref:GNAT family N-acetyltransferase n=1 Tax=Nocardioides marmoriginsengisoli TaxID=661483 RepID=A0A3N0CCQ7_9ACTN|nr:GNAT family N-acetyltransferase [Nocardioides marmoriginsengisoli]RNL61237.1 GNAT family N-acetyltransferase [Nocardioides marmoriginsengisoli]